MKDYWDGNRFICGGVAWAVAPDLSTFCAGVVGAPASDTKAVQSLPSPSDNHCITTLNTTASPDEETTEKTTVVMQSKHAGGRPRKQGLVHPITLWRRKKARQGALL